MGVLEAIAKVLGIKMGQRRHQHRHGSPVKWVNPLGLKRVVIDGKEYLVRDVLSINGDEIVVVDADGTIRTIRRRKPILGIPATANTKKKGGSQEEEATI